MRTTTNDQARVGRNKRSALRRMEIDGTGIGSCVDGAELSVDRRSDLPLGVIRHGLVRTRVGLSCTNLTNVPNQNGVRAMIVERNK
jgi:hypothetical protein